jgi:hypothetical protein
MPYLFINLLSCRGVIPTANVVLFVKPMAALSIVNCDLKHVSIMLKASGLVETTSIDLIFSSSDRQA